MAMCNSCQAPVVWARTERGGRMIPLDANPDGTARHVDDGNLVPVGSATTERGTVPVVRNVKAGAGRWRAHFATCPNARAHRAAR